MRNYNKHIIVVGTGRSGTSWLSEIIATKPRYRMLFEPEHELQTQEGHLICDKFITEESVTYEQKAYYHKIFSNKIDSDWIGQISNRKFKMHLWPIIPKKYVIKFVRCNLSAKYMNDSFGIPVIHIIRHPYAVIFSQQRVKFPWLTDLRNFTNQDQLVRLVMEVSGIDLRNLDMFNNIELLALRWAIENSIPLEVLGGYSSKSVVLKHEELIEDINLFYSICRKFNIEPRKDIENIYGRPSSKTHPKSYIKSGSKNMQELTFEQKGKVKKILQLFNSKLYDL